MEDNSIEALKRRVDALEARARLLVALAEAVWWALVAAVLTLFLVVVPRGGGRILPHVFDVSHVVLSAVVALVAHRLTRRVLGALVELPRWFPWCAGVGAVVFFGGGLELAQNFVPGAPLWSDFAIDVMGGVAGLLLFVPPSGDASRGRRRFLRALGVVVGGVAVAPSISAISSVVIRDKRFPELARFEPRQQSFVYLRGGAKLSAARPPKDAPGFGDAVQLTLPVGGYAGLGLSPPRGNWAPYKELHLPLYSLSDQPVKITLRVHDFGYQGNALDRFSKELTLTSGVNDVRIAITDIQTAPQGRRMALDEISYLSLTSPERAEPVALLLRPWKLQ